MSPTARGRIGGLTTASMYDGVELTRKARDAYRLSFLQGHGCAACPRIEIPADVPDLERHRRAALLRRLHFARLGSKRGAA